VIWACGYETESIPIKNSEGKEISLQNKVPYTQCDVDSKCRLITEDGSILNKVFGSGIAYPMRTNDGMIVSDASKPKPRADGFSLYLNFVANTVLKCILPKSQIEHKIHSTMRDSTKKKLKLKQDQLKTEQETKRKELI
jgi:hypothetical protein